MRKDLGLTDTINNDLNDKEGDDIDSDDGIIIDTTQLNNQIDSYLKNRDSDTN